MTKALSPVRNRLRYILAYISEKRRGLDFTMPDRMYDRRRNDGAMYYASSPAVLNAVFAAVDREKYSRFLDVGCGKGYALKLAAEAGFCRVGGVEYDERLAAICRENLRVTGLGSRVALTCCDAAEYTHYGDYDCFYFFNPFRADVMERVMAAIRRQCRGREIAVVYYHPRYAACIEAAGGLRRVRTLRDSEKDYDIYIYEGRL